MTVPCIVIRPVGDYPPPFVPDRIHNRGMVSRGELVRMAHRAQVAEQQVAETEALRVELRHRLDDDLTARYYTALQEIAERACTSSGLGGSCTYCAPCIARATLGEGPATRQRNEAA